MRCTRNRRAANARAECQQDDSLETPRSPKPRFAEQRGMAVVQHRDRFVEAEKVLTIQPNQPFESARHVHDATAVQCRQAGC